MGLTRIRITILLLLLKCSVSTSSSDGRSRKLTEDEKRVVSLFSPDTAAFHQMMVEDNVAAFLENLATRRQQLKSGVDLENRGMQTVFLDFTPDSTHFEVEARDQNFTFCTVPYPRHVFTEEEKHAITERIKKDYAPWGWEFTTEPLHPLESSYSTLRFFYEQNFFPNPQEFAATIESCADDPPVFVKGNGTASATFVGGVAQNVDFLNTNKNDLAVLDCSDFITFSLNEIGVSSVEFELGVSMLPGETIEEYRTRLLINGCSNIGSHELGHIAGMRHSHAMGPIGNVSLNEFYSHIMASPAFAGNIGGNSSEALRRFYSSDAFFSERSALKLQVSLKGEIAAEGELKRYNAVKGPVMLPKIPVPNTLGFGLNSDVGERLLLKALVVYGTISERDEVDSYRFYLEAGTIAQFEVYSTEDDKFIDFLDATLNLSFVEDDGTLTLVDSGDDDLEGSQDSALAVEISRSGAYELRVAAFPHASPLDSFLTTGDYGLYVYSATLPIQGFNNILVSERKHGKKSRFGSIGKKGRSNNNRKHVRPPIMPK